MTASIEAMAREAGMGNAGNWWKSSGGDMDVHTAQLIRFAALVRALTVEDAAKVCDKVATPYQAAGASVALECAAAIRALPPLE